MQRTRAALQRLKAGDFGLCAQCAEEIDPRRLEFDPAASMCLACASRAEGD